MKSDATQKLLAFLSDWFKGGQAPIHPSTLVDDRETFDELVVAAIKEGDQEGDKFRKAVDQAYQQGFQAGQGLKG